MYQSTSISYDEITAFIADYADRKVVLAIPKEKMAKIKAQAEAQGESVNAYINKAIDQRMERESGE